MLVEVLGSTEADRFLFTLAWNPRKQPDPADLSAQTPEIERRTERRVRASKQQRHAAGWRPVRLFNIKHFVIGANNRLSKFCEEIARRGCRDVLLANERQRIAGPIGRWDILA